MTFDAKWKVRFNACVAHTMAKGVIAVVIEPNVFIESVNHTYKLTDDEASEFIQALNELTNTCGHSMNECALYLAYDFIGAVIQEDQ